MIRLATLKRAERYRFHTMLYKALIKIEQYRVGTNPKIPDILRFEINYIYHVFDRIRKDFMSTDYRRDKLTRIKHKIDLYRQRFFTRDDWDELRAQEYIENGLIEDLQNNTLSLKTLCELKLENPNVIEHLDNVLFKTENPTCNSEMIIAKFRECRYHKNLQQKFFSDSEDELYHLKSLELGHDNVTKLLFDLSKNEHHNRLCANYFSTIGELPDYVKSRLELNFTNKITLRFFLGRFPARRQEILKCMLENAVLLCDIDKFEIAAKTVSSIPRNEFFKIILRGVFKIFEGTYVYNCMKELRMFNFLINDENFYQQMITNMYVINDNYLCIRAMVARSRELITRRDDMKRMWDNYFEMDNCDGILISDNVFNIHDICIQSYGNFDYDDIAYINIPEEFIEGSFARRRIVPFLQKLNILAQRQHKQLNVSMILSTSLKYGCFEVCQWVLDKMLEKEITCNVCWLLGEYLYYCTESDVSSVISLLGPYQKILNFDNLYIFVSSMFACTHTFKYKTISSDTIIRILTWLEDKFDYINIFNSFNVPTDDQINSQEIRYNCKERTLEVIQWITSRLAPYQLPLFYTAIISSPLFENQPVTEWVKAKLEEN